MSEFQTCKPYFSAFGEEQAQLPDRMVPEVGKSGRARRRASSFPRGQSQLDCYVRVARLKRKALSVEGLSVCLVNGTRLIWSVPDHPRWANFMATKRP
jgi:hypothetical protein